MMEALAAIAKFVLYAGAFACAGTALAAASLRRFLVDLNNRAPAVIRISAAATLIACATSAIILMARLGGAFDPTIASILAETPPGFAIALQMDGALVLLCTAGLRGAWSGLAVAGAVALLASFAVNGHAASVDLVSTIVAFLHVAAAAWWFGALLFLHTACSFLASQALADLVRAFSQFALAIVINLIVAGTLLVLTLVDFNHDPWFGDYAQVLSIKICFAAMVVGLAAYNKFRLTPLIAKGDAIATRALRRSIVLEITLIFAVLAATAFLTTFTSPHA